MEYSRISKNIRLFAKANDLTLEQLSNKMGMVTATLKYKLKHHNWYVSELFKVCEVFNIELMQLLKLDLTKGDK